MIINAECESCPLRGRGHPCTRIMFQWTKTHLVRRPEIIVLLSGFLNDHPEAHCASLAVSIDVIEQRTPAKKPDNPAPVANPPKDAGKPQPLTNSQGRTVSPVMMGRIPKATRKDRFSLRDGR